MNNREKNPFTPGSPVPNEIFVGRQKQIDEIIRYIDQASRGRQENIFIIGERGIGKSSLSSFLKAFSKLKKNMVGLHIFLGQVKTLDEMVKIIFDQFINETRNEAWYKDIKSFFEKHIKEIGLFGLKISFNPTPDHLKELIRNFPNALENLITKISDEKDGLFIVLDDINGLVEQRDFANWYKSFVDQVATSQKAFPVCIVLVGLPEKHSQLANLQPSLMRIFRVVNIEKLSDAEVQQFFYRAFRSIGIKVNDDAMKEMVRFSSGLPIIMHEIGDAIFWIDEDFRISQDDAIKGIWNAADKVGQKYLDPTFYKTIRSERYRSILKKMGENSTRFFTKKDVESLLNTNEKKVFHNFLGKLHKLGIIEPDLERVRGSYRFINEIYPVYIYMESKRKKIS